jgi:hypothetical protein
MEQFNLLRVSAETRAIQKVRGLKDGPSFFSMWQHDP